MQNYTSYQNIPPGMSRVERLQGIFGARVTLIPVAWGDKHPILKEFQKLNVGVMTDQVHLSTLEKSKIGILVGPPSGNIISIDFDDEEAEKEFCEANPELVKTVTSKGNRGANYWFPFHIEFIRKTLQEQHPEDEFLELRGIHFSPQNVGGFEEERFKLGKGDFFASHWQTGNQNGGLVIRSRSRN